MTGAKIRARLAAGLILLLATTAAPLAHAIQPDEILKDRKLETRARTIGKGLRCLVCQNESIDDSDADLARDLRLLVRQRLVAGDTDQQVTDFIVARYGNYVLLKPPFIAETWVLWLAPLGLGAVAGGLVYVGYRRSRQAAPADGLSEDQRSRLNALLGDGSDKG